ncbi:MAG: PfkB family carbohydrate kinase [Desulfurivibrio sp.]|nr:PfkB family carbohydrate kinase [Desulfurivibrio sp.]
MIVAIGEVVWDIFPQRRVLGGAPVNVAYHLAVLGEPVRVITRIGYDELAAATDERLSQLGLPLEGVQRDLRLPTGQVRVSFGEDNEPAYDIVAPAAWDRIEPAAALAAAGTGEFDLVFGTLAQRAETSRRAIRALASRARRRFYDVNLRPPFTTAELVRESLELAELVKVNESELRQVADWLALDDGEQESDLQGLAAAIRRHCQLEALVVTAGAAGSWVATAAGMVSAAGEPVTVADTVGAGDAFFATLIADYRRELDRGLAPAALPWSAILARANRRGAYVAGQPGATPEMPAEL